VYAHFSAAGKDPLGGVRAATLVSAGLCAVSVVCCIVLGMLDSYGEREGTVPPLVKKKKKKRAAEATTTPLLEDGVGRSVSAPISEPRRGLTDDDLNTDDEVEEASSTDDDSDDISFQDLKKVLGLRECLIYAITVFFYGAVFVFVSFGKKFIASKWPACADQAKFYLSLPYLISAGASTLCGFLVDKLGRGVVWVAASSLSLCCIHLFLLLSPPGKAHTCGSLPPPLIAMIWLGLTYSACAASIWPLLSNIVSTKYLGTGYGFMTAVQNLGLAVFPSLITALLGSSSDSSIAGSRMELAFVSMAAMAFVISIVLLLVDSSHPDGNLLNATPAQVKRRLLLEVRTMPNATPKFYRDKRRIYGNSPSLAEARSYFLPALATMQSPRTNDQIRRAYILKLDRMYRNKGGLS